MIFKRALPTQTVLRFAMHCFPEKYSQGSGVLRFATPLHKKKPNKQKITPQKTQNQPNKKHSLISLIQKRLEDSKFSGLGTYCNSQSYF